MTEETCKKGIALLKSIEELKDMLESIDVWESETESDSAFHCFTGKFTDGGSNTIDLTGTGLVPICLQHLRDIISAKLKESKLEFGAL